jgi:hypothetical protein
MIASISTARRPFPVGPAAPAAHRTRGPPRFDFRQIRELLGEAVAGRAGWQRWFHLATIRPSRLGKTPVSSAA